MRDKLNIDGVNVYYKGDISRGAVVFLHGGSLNGQVFREQFSQISLFPMVAIDLPGHGHSERAADPGAVYNIPAYARLVSGLVGKLGLEDIILAGHSLGANIATEAAATLPSLQGLFLFSMSPFCMPPRLDLMCVPNPFLGYLVGGRLRPAEALLLAGEMVENNGELSELLASWILETDMAARLSFAASLGLDHFADELCILAHFQKPLAVLWGKTDRFINPLYLQRLAPVSLWQNGIIELDAGHVPQLESPGQFNTVLEAFYKHVKRQVCSDSNVCNTGNCV